MLNKNGQRELAYVVKVNEVKPIAGKDRVECAIVNGWTVMVRKDQFKAGSLGIYFEVDSKCPETEPFKFLESKHYKIKIQKYKTDEGPFYSQGLLMGAEDFGWELTTTGQFAGDAPVIKTTDNKIYAEGDFLTEELGVTYAVEEDNQRKSDKPEDKYKKMAQWYPEAFKKPFIRWLYKRNWGKVILSLFFKPKKKSDTSFPNQFPFIKKTDQERVENMPFVLQDKTPFIVTQKCDGSSATYILERKKKGKKESFEFYVCSRNVRMLKPDQECFHDKNYYWECAEKYDIENKLRDFLNQHDDLDYVCWQGEICAPSIQSNPHNLKETHLFCFHMIDSKQGKYDIRDAAKIWKEYDMEVVPILGQLIMPDDLEDLKVMADGYYDDSVCEGQTNCKREGYVYYKTTDPNFSFKNVSREYLLKHS